MSGPRTNTVQVGYGLGGMIAVTISWSLHKSIVWAIVQGALSWIYVLYYAFTRPGGYGG